jgi:hypothetical protein
MLTGVATRFEAIAVLGCLFVGEALLGGPLLRETSQQPTQSAVSLCGQAPIDTTGWRYVSLDSVTRLRIPSILVEARGGSDTTRLGGAADPQHVTRAWRARDLSLAVRVEIDRDGARPVETSQMRGFKECSAVIDGRTALLIAYIQAEPGVSMPYILFARISTVPGQALYVWISAADSVVSLSGPTIVKSVRIGTK